MKPIFCGVSGGTGSGKTSICKKVCAQMPGRKLTIISQDWYYLPLKEGVDASLHNWDHPNSIDWKEMGENLSELIAGNPAFAPQWDMTDHTRKAERKRIEPADIYLIEGIMVFTDPVVRDLFDVKVFVDVDADTRLIRRIRRDATERSRSLSSILDQYERFVKPGFDTHIYPTRKFADIIIPRGAENQVAIDFLVHKLIIPIG